MKDYHAKKFTNFITMPDGIENEMWDDVANLVSEVESLACSLRSKLEELADTMRCNDVELGEDCVGPYEVEDYANSVADIEEYFDYESDKDND